MATLRWCGGVLGLSLLGLTAPALAEGETAGPFQDSTLGAAAVMEIVVDVELDAAEFPVGGVVSGHCFTCSTEEDVSIATQDGTPIAGTFSWDELWNFVFTADEPLEIGAYKATVSSGYAGLGSFSVVADDGLPPHVDVRLGTYQTPVGETFSCTTATGTEPTFKDQTSTGVYLQVVLSGLAATQSSYELLIDDELASGPTSPILYTQLGDEDREVCADVKATSHIDGSTEVLYHECIQTSSVGDVGVRNELSEKAIATLEWCLAPPEGYEDVWCGLFANAFETHSCTGFNEEACQAARADCPDGDAPMGDGESGDGESGDGESGDGLGDDDALGNSGGCSVIPAQRGATSAWAWLAALGLLVGVARRRATLRVNR